MGGEQDPYNEPIPEDELKFYQRKGSKRKRKLPETLSKHDFKILKNVRDKAHCLDLSMSFCGFRFGWAGIIGLIPWIGDVCALFLSLRLVKAAQKIEGGLPDHIYSKMMLNITVDFVLGLIPIVGDVVNIAYKANSRNYLMLEKFLVDKYESTVAAAVVAVPPAM